MKLVYVAMALPSRLSELERLTGLIRRAMEAIGGTEDDVAAIELAAHEIAVNVVEHAYGSRADGRITVRFSADPELARVTLRDQGQCFDRKSVPQPAPGEVRERGYGLLLVERLMDRAIYSPGAAGNTWILEKRLNNNEAEDC